MRKLFWHYTFIAIHATYAGLEAMHGADVTSIAACIAAVAVAIDAWAAHQA